VLWINSAQCMYIFIAYIPMAFNFITCCDIFTGKSNFSLLVPPLLSYLML
jgi:hypothetical protein